MTNNPIKTTNLFLYIRRVLTILRAFRSDYSYSLDDYFQYFKNAENPGLGINSLSQRFEDYDERFIRIKIGNDEIIWPRQYNPDGLLYMYNEVFEPATHNPHAYERYGAKISVGDHVIDGGGCEGFFTLYCLKKGAIITIIEPVHLLAEALTITFQKEIESGFVKVINGALGNKTNNGFLVENPKKI